LLLNIEKLIYGGDGLARLPANDTDPGRGKAVFVPFVLPGETIDATLTEEKPGFARAHAAAIIQPSPHRTPPPCPHFTHCGGCHYQHATYDYQLEIKKEILRENLRRIAKLELPCEIVVHPSPPWNYRNRSRLQVRTQPHFAAGYFKFASHQLLPVEECPLSSPLINRGIAALWQSGRAGKAIPGVHEIEFFSNDDDTRLLLEFLCAPEAPRAAVRAWAEDLSASMPQIAGIAAFRETQKGVQEPLVAVGDSHLTYKTSTHKTAYRVSAGSFFQTNRFLTDDLVDLVTAGRSGELALDLYAGVGLFSTALSCAFRHIVSVETSQTAARDLQYNLPVNGKAVHAAVEHYLTAARIDTVRVGEHSHGRAENRAAENRSTGKRSAGKRGAENSRDRNEAVLPQLLHKPDLLVVDPPRGGLGDRVTRSLANLGAPRITYVSCDPATLSRDLVPLQAAGYRIEQLHLVDLFPQTYHLETVAQLVRS
jgi:23S rRNA (uracil1939-C5)-methyltransferase